MALFNKILSIYPIDHSYHLNKKHRNNLLVLLTTNLPEQNDWLDNSNAFTPYISWFENGIKSYIKIPYNNINLKNNVDIGSIFKAFSYNKFKRHYDPVSLLNKADNCYKILNLIRKKLYFRRIVKRKIKIIRRPKHFKNKKGRIIKFKKSKRRQFQRVKIKYIISGFCKYKKRYKIKHRYKKIRQLRISNTYRLETPKIISKKKNKKNNKGKFNSFKRRKKRRLVIRTLKTSFIKKRNKRLGNNITFYNLNSEIKFSKNILYI